MIGLAEKAYGGRCKYCDFELTKEEVLFILNELENITSIDDLKDEDIAEKINELYITYRQKIQATLIKIIENKIELLCEEFSDKYFEEHISGHVEYREEMLVQGTIDVNLDSYDLGINKDNKIY